MLCAFMLEFIPVMATLNFQDHYFSLQCHMILQKLYNFLILRKFPVLEVVLLNMFVETVTKHTHTNTHYYFYFI